jgi:nitrogenase molybdenum-cofactor synthesis protein NifE
MTKTSFIKYLNHLSEIKNSRDIFGKCNAVSLGVFCPTFGVSVCAPLIDDAAVMVVGTPECLWYAKNSCVHHCNVKNYDKFYCCALDERDIVFGDNGGICKAICKIADDTDINCIFLASTCVPEIIGEDIEAIASEAEKKSGVAVLPVRIAHYDHQCIEFGVAISRTLEALGRLMTPQKKHPNKVNLLGRTFHSGQNNSLEDSELVRLLKKYGIEINLILPEKCTTRKIAKAPQSALNIITDATGYDLAVYMYHQFDIPYVHFEPSLSLDDIDQSYKKIQSELDLDMTTDLYKLKNDTKNAVAAARAVLAGKTFINGGRPPDAFEAASFLAELGMKPLLINGYRVYKNSSKYIEEILAKGNDPLVNYVANPDATFPLISALAPDLCISHGEQELFLKMGIKHLELLIPAKMRGYEGINHTLTKLNEIFHDVTQQK